LLVFSGDGVAIFLLISGYGISKSLNKRDHNFKAFLIKRINRVMIPYWAATVIILALDYLLLQRTYNIPQIFLSLIGINLYGVMHNFDYVRWYITFLFFWYLIGYCSHKIIKYNILGFVLLIVGLVFFILDYYILKFGWYQYMAFPMGWWVATYEERYIKLINRLIRWNG
jgi:peptidoglycan/LPS O-acetylase OafA/YrhL